MCAGAFLFSLVSKLLWSGPFLSGAWGDLMIFPQVKNFPERIVKKVLKAGNGITEGVLTHPASYRFLILS